MVGGRIVDPVGDRFHRALEAAVVLAALATVPLTIAPARNPPSPAVLAGDWAVWAVFLLEYAILLAVARDRRAFARSNWLSLAVVVLSFPMLPALMGFVRLTRLVRLLRLARVPLVLLRGLGALRLAIGRPGLLYLAAANVFLILAGGALLYLAEPEEVKGSIWNGVWLAIVTATTVGYGDLAPAGPWGRVIAIVLMLAGVGLVSTLAASIAAYFVGQDRHSAAHGDDAAAAQASLHAELVRLTDKIDRLEQAVARLAETQSEGRAGRAAGPGDGH